MLETVRPIAKNGANLYQKPNKTILTKTISDNGFSLIELLVTIVILGVLGTIVMFGISKFRDDANSSTDQANLVLLNKAATIYNAKAPKGEYNSLPSDTVRIARLFERGLLEDTNGTNTITPMVENASFVWNKDQEKWQYFVNNVEIIDFASQGIQPSSYTRIGNWGKNSYGFVSPTPGGGLLFIPNNRSEYTINSTAKLGTGTGVGYGILFNTKLNQSNQDTGYALQFDRGLRAIVIRPRTNGGESGTVRTWNSGNTGGLVPSDPANTWWTDEHTITIKVDNVTNTSGRATVSIDNVQLGNYTFNNPVPADKNHTGFRTWYSSTTSANFNKLTIQ